MSRLQQILEQDRSLAEKISGADESMQAFFRRAAETRVPAGEDALLSRLAKRRLRKKGGYGKIWATEKMPTKLNCRLFADNRGPDPERKDGLRGRPDCLPG